MRRRIIATGIAVLLAVAGTLALVAYVQSAKEEAIADERLVDVYVVGQHIDRGAPAETITSRVELTQVPARLRQPGAVDDLGQLYGLVAAVDLEPGDQLITARLVPAAAVEAEVPDDLVRVTVALEPERAVGGSLTPGDRVAVFLSFDPFDSSDAGGATQPGDAAPDTSAPPTTALGGRDRTPNMTHLELHKVPVVAVQFQERVSGIGSNDEEVDLETTSPEGRVLVTLALSPADAEQLVFAGEFGHVWLAEEPDGVPETSTRIVTLGDAYEVRVR